MTETEVHTLFEREAELAAVADAVERATHGSGSVLLIHGEPGIGKTALLRAAGRAASEAGIATLSARGSELEREFGFGVVRQLFEREARNPAQFSGQARIAARVLGVEDEGAPRPKPP